MHSLNGNAMQMEIDYMNIKFENFEIWSSKNENGGIVN